MFFSVAGKILSVPFSQQDTQEISQPAVCDYFLGEGRVLFFFFFFFWSLSVFRVSTASSGLNARKSQ